MPTNSFEENFQETYRKTDFSSSGIVKDVKKIGVLRANALGDFIVTLPALAAIKKTYPDAELVLFGKPWHEKFLISGRSVVDRVIVVPVIEGVIDESNLSSSKEEKDEFFFQMKEENFDIGIHFQGKGIAASKFLNAIGPRVSAGMNCEESDSMNRTINYFYYQNEVARYLEVATLIGAKPDILDPRINLLPQDQIEFNHFYSNYLNKDYIVIHTCATDIRRMWTQEKFARLSAILLMQNYKLVFTGTDRDNDYVQNIIKDLGENAINACGQLSLGGLAALFYNSSLVISVDTGPMHLAQAVGAKTIGLFWAPNAINWSYLTRKNHIPVISWQMNCPNCNIIPNDPFPFEPKTSFCSHDFSFIDSIEPEQVIDRSLELLKQ